MAQPHMPVNLADTEAAMHTVPLPAKILVMVEAKTHVTHVLSLGA